MSATCSSSRRIRSPPRSPSTNTVAFFLTLRSATIWGTLVPSTATVFLIPHFSRFSTSARPSTMMIASESSTLGPAGSRSSPMEDTFSTRMDSRTSARISLVEIPTSSNDSSSSSFARSTICRRLIARRSSIPCTLIVETQGPTRSIVSRDAARIAVSARSREDAM